MSAWLRRRLRWCRSVASIGPSDCLRPVLSRLEGALACVTPFLDFEAIMRCGVLGTDVTRLTGTIGVGRQVIQWFLAFVVPLVLEAHAIPAVEKVHHPWSKATAAVSPFYGSSSLATHRPLV